MCGVPNTLGVIIALTLLARRPQQVKVSETSDIRLNRKENDAHIARDARVRKRCVRFRFSMRNPQRESLQTVVYFEFPWSALATVAVVVVKPTLP